MSHTTLRIGRNRRNFAIFSKKKSRRASFSGAVRIWGRISFDPESTAKQMVDPPLCLLVGNRPVVFAPVCCTQRPLLILVPAISPGRERGTNVDVSRRETRRTTRRTTQRWRIGARVLSVPSHSEKRVCRIGLVLQRIDEVFTAVENITNDVTLSPSSLPRLIFQCVEPDLKGSHPPWNVPLSQHGALGTALLSLHHELPSPSPRPPRAP